MKRRNKRMIACAQKSSSAVPRVFMVGLGSVLLTCLTQNAMASTATVSLLPHQAVYDLRLLDASQRSGITGIDGRAAFDIAGSACDGYVLNTRLVFRTKLRTGRTVIADSRVSTFETGDGSQLSFTTTDFLNGQETEKTKGMATREDGVLKVELDEPERDPFDLRDEGTVFPALQMKSILAAAKEGKTLITMPLYDGTQSGDQLYQTTAIIRPISPDSENPSLLADEETIDTSQIWRVTISYFEDSNDVASAETPISEISFDLYDKGVTDNLVLDYGDYSLGGTLAEYVPRNEVECEKN